jgi:hypothetical protein
LPFPTSDPRAPMPFSCTTSATTISRCRSAAEPRLCDRDPVTRSSAFRNLVPGAAFAGLLRVGCAACVRQILAAYSVSGEDCAGCISHIRLFMIMNMRTVPECRRSR